MQTPRQILETALREPLDYEAARAAIRNALGALPGLEADAARWAGFRQAVTDQNETWFEVFGDAEHVGEIPTAEELNVAADAANRATS